MKKTLVFSVVLLFAAAMPGFPQAFRKFDKILNVGVGYQTYAVGGLCHGGSFEMGLSDEVSVGGFFDYARYGQMPGNQQWKSQFLNFGIRGSWHLGKLMNSLTGRFDPYAGLSLGTRSAVHRSRSDQTRDLLPRARGLFPGIHLGGLYRFSRKIGGFAEAALGMTSVRLGLTGKF
ncbi:hypothetical protein [Larkinella soli]|uniref:hypothetical protein n=1 Tax=Larkinella soli TaxID=1770527 RepID=UPI000FFC8892|nr:hypothetical protein [Larkinella soli]